MLAETTPTPCTVPSTCPLVKVAIFGPASELGWVQQQQMVVVVENRLRLKKIIKKNAGASLGQNSVPRSSRARADSALVLSKPIFTLM